VREPVDAKVRAALMRAGCTWTRVAGFGATRTQAALAAIRPVLPPAPQPPLAKD
jgi:hypothetical protein